MFGSSTLEASDKVVLKAPGIAENGAVVPISINAEQLENVESISIFSEKNPTPLVARFKLKPGCVPEVSTRIKMGESGDVIAVPTSRSPWVAVAVNSAPLKIPLWRNIQCQKSNSAPP